MIHIEDRHLNIVKNILEKYPYTFYVYGSRSKGTNKRFSDLDLCVMEDISIDLAGKILAEFEESDLPFKVDLLRWQKTSDSFKNLIKPDLKLMIL